MFGVQFVSAFVSGDGSIRDGLRFLLYMVGSQWMRAVRLGRRHEVSREHEVVADEKPKDNRRERSHMRWDILAVPTRHSV